MDYSLKPNEIIGFLNMLMADEHQQKQWIRAIPKLANIDFKGIIEFISQNDILNTDFFKQIDPISYSLEDFKKFFQEDKQKQLKIAYEGYQSFYKDSGIEKYARQIEQAINSLGKNTLENMAYFYGFKNASEYTSTAYAIASIDGNGCCSLSGQEKSFQLLMLKMPVDKEPNINRDLKKLFHETAHGIFEDSGAEIILKNYLKQKNQITDLINKQPKLKRHKNDNAQIMVDEFLATSFQNIFATDFLSTKSSYADPTIATMAKKLVPQIRLALSKKKIFDDLFIKNVIEKTFVETFSLNRSKQYFPKWLPNPSWLRRPR